MKAKRNQKNPTKHPWVSASGVRLLRRIQKQITKKPETYRQDDWHCGTAMCIAGHAAMMSGCVIGVRKDPDLDEFAPVGPSGRRLSWFSWPNLGAKALGLSRDDTSTLFCSAEEWPEPFCVEWDLIDPEDYAARAAVAARRIDHFIETGQ